MVPFVSLLMLVDLCQKTEKNYSAHKLEFLALKWAVTEGFHEYLYGGEFEVYTDKIMY